MLFLGHARTIEKLSAKRQVMAKYRVAQVIKEEELHYIEETTAASTSGTNNAPSPSYQRSSTCETSNELPNSPFYFYATNSPPESDNSLTCNSEATTWEACRNVIKPRNILVFLTICAATEEGHIR
ncbi:hypothetical protein JTB14_027386 [Gonioctena quinquepunctata]|nr:hypothetical protein JTB14_027386 [Gonioctena quinquepunctata]